LSDSGVARLKEGIALVRENASIMIGKPRYRSVVICGTDGCDGHLGNKDAQVGAESAIGFIWCLFGVRQINPHYISGSMTARLVYQ
jgi:hypothetical protein